MSPSRHTIVKDGWGSRQNFQASYGLGMTPDDIEEGNAILDAMAKYDSEAGHESHSASNRADSEYESDSDISHPGYPDETMDDTVDEEEHPDEATKDDDEGSVEDVGETQKDDYDDYDDSPEDDDSDY